MAVVSFVVAEMVPPGATARDAAASVGRVASVPSAFSRYGGVYICPSSWLQLRPSGSGQQLLWLGFTFKSSYRMRSSVR